MNPYKDVDESSFSSSPHLSYEDIATKLLKDHYFLTALELHTELVESGKELPQLREFFSNPGNFEQHVSRASEFTSMHRSPSQTTLDSLDTARYSEDGGGDRAGSGNDVAVLEFELRKARETINALRANLTQFADGESALDKTSKDNFDQRSLKPHEKRALNFLINEYLLLQDYKLTSITFSDENPDQEFEDWDDVGLNMPRPANLISLFRGDSAGLCARKLDAATEMDCQYLEKECQTNVEEGSRKTMESETDWDHEIHIQAAEIELLKEKIIALETEKLNFQTLYDAAIVSLNSLTTPTTEFKGIELNLPEETLARAKEGLNHRQEANERPLTCTATENHYGSGTTTHSATPEQFEMIDSERNSGIARKNSHTSSLDPTLENSAPSPLRRSLTTLDDTLSINEEWTRVHCDYTSIETSKEMWIDSALPTNLKESLLNLCSETLNLNEPLSNDLLSELVTSEKPITLPGLLTLVADTLPRIIPHTLIGRRCEAAALLAASAALLPPGAPRRAATLHTLLTLVKKPDHADTRAICEAACLIVKWGGSGEVLSSVAELLASKSPERRLLASQICVAIAPYVSIEFCTSLLLSLVTLMCESSEGEIRSLGLKSACIICPVTEHKYGQLENIFFAFLKDPLEKNVKDAVNVFAPVLARSALIAGKFASDLFIRILANLSKAQSEWKSVVLYIDVLRILVLAQLAYVVNVQIVREVTSCDMLLEEISLNGENRFFLDLQCYVDDAKMLLGGMNRLLKEDPDVRWAELNWFIKTIKQILEVGVNSKILNHTAIFESLLTLFNDIVTNFGINFASNVLRHIFVEIITDLEGKMEKLHSVNVDNTVVVGIYLVTVLPVVADAQEDGEFMQKWVVYSSIRGLPVKLFTIPLKWVAKYKADRLDSYLQLLREFAASSCESPNGASIRIYIATLIAELLNIVEVKENSIEKQVMPAVVALLHDDDVSVREVAITAWGSLSRSCIIRGLDCGAQCWPPVDDMLATRPLAGREASRIAEALALLVLPTADNHNVSEKAVSLICGMCHMDNLKAETLASLAPGLQLCAHHGRHHPSFLPALRKLEEVVQTPSLSQFKPAIDALLHNMGSINTEIRDNTPRTPSNLHTAQEVGRRVTQMFQQSKTNMNLQSIFKKKM